MSTDNLCVNKPIIGYNLFITLMDSEKKNKRFSVLKKRRLRRVGLWSLVAIYTALLPNARLVYDWITDAISFTLADRIPMVIVLLLITGYFTFCLKRKKKINFSGLLLPSSLIILGIIWFESIKVKYIHIPEYMLMTWFVFAAMSEDYRGKGLLLLVLLCSCLLGVVDELEQGLYPGRYYGWKDMVINSSSAIIGILTIKELKQLPEGDFGWTVYLLPIKRFFYFIAFSLLGAVLMCIKLFDTIPDEPLLNTYPAWLLAWNVLSTLFGTAVVLYFSLKSKPEKTYQDDEIYMTDQGDRITARLWCIVPLSVLTIMHAIAIVAAVSGWDFQ